MIADSAAIGLWSRDLGDEKWLLRLTIFAIGGREIRETEIAIAATAAVPAQRGLRNARYAKQMRYRYGSLALVKSPSASVNRGNSKAGRRLFSDPKQANNRLLGRGDSVIYDDHPDAPCDRKSH